MNMFDEIEKIEDAGGSGSYKMPVGTHAATVSDLKIDHDTGYVDFKYTFLGTDLWGYNRWFLKNNNADKQKKARSMYSKQLRNAGFEVADMASLGRALNALEGRTVLVDVSNDKQNDKYQRYWISGVYVPKRTAVTEPGSAADDGLPFAIFLAPLAAAMMGILS